MEKEPIKKENTSKDMNEADTLLTKEEYAQCKHAIVSFKKGKGTPLDLHAGHDGC